MGHWIDEDLDDDGAAPWALGDDEPEPLGAWDGDDNGDGSDGGGPADDWLEEQLARLGPPPAAGHADGGGVEPGGGAVLRRPAPGRVPRRRRADPDAAADLPAPVVPGYVRDRRGTWRYAATGRAVPGARDLTLRSLYRFPVDHDRVAVPADLVRSEAELAWCLAWKHTLTTRLAGGHSLTVVRVPVGEWERRADVPFGLWAPELTATRLLSIGDVADLARVTPATITAYLSRGRLPAPVTRLGGTPLWSRPVIRQWLADRPGQGRRRRRRHPRVK
jgi:predicted DNA-binding transcriptional regulator AlpA